MCVRVYRVRSGEGTSRTIERKGIFAMLVRRASRTTERVEGGEKTGRSYHECVHVRVDAGWLPEFQQSPSNRDETEFSSEVFDLW